MYVCMYKGVVVVTGKLAGNESTDYLTKLATQNDKIGNYLESSISQVQSQIRLKSLKDEDII